MEIKESEATILLLIIILASSLFKDEKVFIPENHITIIDYDQTPYFSSTNPDDQPSDNLNIEIDTSGHSISNIKPNFGRNWMKRYKSGIRFEFYPP